MFAFPNIYNQQNVMFLGYSPTVKNFSSVSGDVEKMKNLIVVCSTIPGISQNNYTPSRINESYLLHKIYNKYPNASRTEKEIRVHKFNAWVIKSTVNKPLDWEPTIEEWEEYEQNNPSYPELESLIDNGFFNIKYILRYQRTQSNKDDHIELIENPNQTLNN